MRPFFPAILLLISLSSSVAFESKKMSVRFLIEGAKEEIEGGFSYETNVGETEQRKVIVGTIPVINESDIESVYTFESADGTMGAYFTLNPHGRLVLETTTAQRVGRRMVGLLAGRTVITMVIDKKVTDGVIGFPSGLTAVEATQLQKNFKSKKKDK